MIQKRSVPFFSLSKQVSDHKSLFIDCITQVLDSQNFVGGPVVQQFETKLAAYLGIPHATSCNSGTDALWLALKALDLQTNDIVLTTPFSFIASSSEIVSLGGHPVFIDIDENSFNIDPVLMHVWLEANAEMKDGQAVHKKTGFKIVGMVIVDIFGQSASYEALKTIAKTWCLWIVEDACQSIGAMDGTKKAGTLGTIGVFSFYPTKNLGAYGEGGACVTDNPYLAECLFTLRNHGRKTHYEYEVLGINSRLDGMQAAILAVKLDLLDGYNLRRRAIAQYYQEKLADLVSIRLPREENGFHVYHQFCITTETSEMRTMLQKHLTDAGIGTNIYYPKPLFDIPFLNTHKDLVNSCLITQQKTETILALPIWPELESDDLDYIIGNIRDFDQKMQPQQKQPVEKKRMKREERAQQISLF